MVRKKAISMSALEINQYLRTRSYPQWHDGYSLMLSTYRIEVNKGVAIILYMMKNQLEFDVGRTIVKMIAEATRRPNLCLIFPCLITHFIEEVEIRVDRVADDILSLSGYVGRRAYIEAVEGKRVEKLLTTATIRKQKRE
ncbi:hypothetical protein Dsin_001090 [Dipteronia sinensis]|uniref:Uncharacterized protein n=1 Tax=Dipteronia sinensis TaxID=43782 RepID=A0AAE0EIE7_9ROSI|nr:hypothetical protein Dsin_001090 [Dipteronia sinensis]